MKKENCSIDNIDKRVGELMIDIQNNLFSAAFDLREESNKKVDSWRKFLSAIKKGGYVFAYWRGDKSCETEIKEKTKVVSRLLPLNTEEESEHKCIYCGKKINTAKRWAFATAY